MESLNEKILKKVKFNPLGWEVFKSSDNPEKAPRASIHLKSGDAIPKFFSNHSFCSKPSLNVSSGGYKIVVTEEESTFWNNSLVPNRYVYFEEEDGDSYFNLFSDEVGGGSMTSFRLQTRSVYDCHVIMVRTKIVCGKEYNLLALLHSNSGIFPGLKSESEEENKRIFSKWQESQALLRDAKSTPSQVQEKYHTVDQFVFSEFIIKVLKAKKIFENQIKMTVPNISPNLPRVITRSKRIENKVFLRDLGQETLELAIATCRPFKLNRKKSFMEILENCGITSENILFRNFYYSSQKESILDVNPEFTPFSINVCLFPYGKSQISLFTSPEEVQADNINFDRTYSREDNREMMFEMKTELSSKINRLGENLGGRIDKLSEEVGNLSEEVGNLSEEVGTIHGKVGLIIDHLMIKIPEEEEKKKRQKIEEEKYCYLTGKKRKREEEEEEGKEENIKILKKRKLDNDVVKDKKKKE